jgi:MoaA/NifB/PqqE/SkfB family radical SAM enzyme
MPRCRHAFESASIHANGEVVCSIIDGRADFVLGNVYQQSLPDILNGPRAKELQRLVLSTDDQYCRAIGKTCPLKSMPVEEDIPTTLRYLAIEPTTACDLRCLSCPVRDFSGDVNWRHALRDGGASFALWDGVRRIKQHAADAAKRAVPRLARLTPADLSRPMAMLLRGRTPAARRGTLPIDVVKRVIDDAGPGLRRIDFFNYGEPFLYRHLLDALRYIRLVRPKTGIAISTDGLQVREDVERAIVSEGLLDWITFSVDGCDAQSYRRYRIRGTFDTAFANLVRFHRRAQGSGIRVTWQYVVFRWNDRDAQFHRAIEMAAREGLTIHFDFAHSWGRSRRRPDTIRYLAPYLKPFTALPGEPRQDGW